MTNKISIAIFVITCALAFAVMANGYRPVQNMLKYMFPILEYPKIPYYDVYKTAGDNQ